KSSISFTAEGYQKPIRLTGELYGKSYSGIESSAAKQAERTASFTRQRHERIKENKQQLQQQNRHLARQRRKIYQPPYGKATSSELAISHDIEPDSATGRDSARAIPDTRIRNQSVSALPSNSKVARQPDSVVLPDHKAIEEKNKKTINQYANDHTDQSKGPSTWVSEVLTKLRAAIKSFA
ncbi:hypothetical protein R7P79_28045, partial [Vibrio sp. 2128(2023)]|nr:hypothetical protein [Vibrio sp. 2128(2023)]